MLLESSSTQFQYDVLVNSKSVLVHMGIPASLTCIAMQPILNALAAAYAEHLDIVQIDLDEAPDLVNRYHIREAPTFLLFHHGALIEAKAGYLNQRTMEAWLDLRFG